MPSIIDECDPVILYANYIQIRQLDVSCGHPVKVPLKTLLMELGIILICSMLPMGDWHGAFPLV